VSVAAETPDDADAALIDALRRDDPDAVEQLVERYGDDVYRLAMRLTGSSDDAEAVTRDTLCTVGRGIERLPRASAFATWIRRIAAEKAYRTLRAREANVERIALSAVMPELDADGRHFASSDDWSKRLGDASLAGAAHRALTGAIDALPADYRVAFVLHDVEGLSNVDVGGALGISPHDVKSRVHHARLFLRQRLAQRLGAT
jgi:RNA polymerase sigma-70 factor (ECF subfamily)